MKGIKASELIAMKRPAKEGHIRAQWAPNLRLFWKKGTTPGAHAYANRLRHPFNHLKHNP